MTAVPRHLPRTPGPRFALPWLAAMLAPLLAPLPAQAQVPATARSFLAIGAIALPEFEGASDQRAAPLLVGRIDFGASGSLRLTGLGAQFNLMDASSPWAFGPLVSLRTPRDADVDDEVVRRLREVDGAVEAGAFVEFGLRDTLAGGDRLSLGLEAKGGKGSQLALTAGYLAPKPGTWQLAVDARAVFANDKLMDTLFSVDADNSARSGLPVYTASSGVKNVAFGLTVSHDLDGDWLLLGRLGYSRLLGDAADSPIVQLRGRAGSGSLGLAVGRRF